MQNRQIIEEYVGGHPYPNEIDMGLVARKRIVFEKHERDGYFIFRGVFELQQGATLLHRVMERISDHITFQVRSFFATVAPHSRKFPPPGGFFVRLKERTAAAFTGQAITLWWQTNHVILSPFEGCPYYNAVTSTSPCGLVPRLVGNSARGATTLKVTYQIVRAGRDDVILVCTGEMGALACLPRHPEPNPLNIVHESLSSKAPEQRSPNFHVRDSSLRSE